MRRVPVLFAFLLIAVVASAGPLELPRPNEKWVAFRVDEFTFVSSVSPAATSDIARDLLRMRNAIGQITKLKVRSSKPTRVFIFSSERAFAPYRDAIMRRTNANVGGIFIATDGGNFIVMKREGREDIDRTVYHELTHYFVRNTMSGLPLWASEGIAEYYSTFRTAGDQVHLGYPILDHVHWLRQGQMIPLRELLATTVDSPNYNEESRQGVFYAQSWAFFHFLALDDGRRAQFSNFLGLIRAGRPVDDAFTSAFEKSYADVERDLRTYVRGHAFAFAKFPLSELEAPDVPAPAAMSRDEVLYELGHLVAHAAPAVAPQAQKYFDEALVANPDHSGAHADLGRLHHLGGRKREAEASFARAVELGNRDAHVHLLVGMSVLEEYEGVRINPPHEAMLKARAAFEKSVEIDPTSAPAWTGIGATYVMSNDDPAKGIAALEKSLALVPGDVTSAFHLVQLYARVGKRAEAQRLIDTVLARGDTPADMLDFARKVVARAEAFDQANRMIDRINDAIRHANTGDSKKALEILDGLIPEITDPEILRKAKELRADLAAEIKKD